VGVEILDAVIVIADNVLDGGQIASDAALGDVKERLFSFVYGLVYFFLFLVGQLRDFTGRADQSPSDGSVFDDVAVGFYVDGAGDGVDETCDVCCAADFL
jgi:hypothetical protein